MEPSGRPVRSNPRVQIRIQNLSKTYPNGVKALDNVSLTIPCGMYGLLGPNGAGKSTLMRTLATLQEPDSGSAALGDLDVLRQKDEVRRRLGYLPQDFGVYPRISAQDMLDHIAMLKGMTHSGERKQRVEAMLQRCNLYDLRKKSLAGFSGGMRQRFGIAQALIGNPELLIVDEPTAGSRSRRAQSLLQLTGRDRRAGDRDSLHPHRRRRDGSVQPHGDHSLKAGCSMKARPTTLSRHCAGAYGSAPSPNPIWPNTRQRCHVISSRLVGGRPFLHVLSEEPPGDGFASGAADLEDVFFTRIRGWN